MSSAVMAVEVTSSELVAVRVDPRDAPVDPVGPAASVQSAPLGADGDAVDRLADAFAVLLEGVDRPARLVVATPADTERRRFEEIAEATALVGLPAPSWLPGPVAAVGARIAGGTVGDRSLVLDARGGALTAWPVVRTDDGAEVAARGPVATGTRLDQLLLGVVRAQLRSLDPTAGDVGGPRPGVRGDGDTRGEAARLRREVRRARSRLADTDAAEARVDAGTHTVTVDRAVFDQLVEHAVRETVTEVERSAGPEDVDRPTVVHVLADDTTPLARRLTALVGGDAPVVPRTPDDGVLGLAALLAPPRPRATRAASGAQAIRARRSVGSPSAPVGVGAAVGGTTVGAGPAPEEPSAPREPRTPPQGLPLDPRADGGVEEPPRPEETTVVGGEPVPAVTHDDAAEERVPEIPAARLPSTPVQAQRGSDGWPRAFGTGAGTPALVADSGSGRAVNGSGVAGHAALAAARPHDARPTSDAPPGGSGPLRHPDPEPAPTPLAASPGTGPLVRARRGPDTAPQPVVAPAAAGRAPRGAVPVLVVLLLVAVLAAVGVLVLGPDGIGAAFGGLGTGVVQLVTAWT
ncbi:hypothetical protein [Actinomycetospora soli]|uniref:hypothetical protein n=1 Tax=Actinomycetospora soli TaxID=2893887 RepID=UPI001E3F4654|nr:hypothetical protein [Actinomycetospora soli]MCD2186325.1 hypothetical protein [Actinomycetospora soli]